MAINPNIVNIINIEDLTNVPTIHNNDYIVIGRGIKARKSTVIELYNTFGIPSILSSISSLENAINNVNQNTLNSVSYLPQSKTDSEKATARNNINVLSVAETLSAIDLAVLNNDNVVNYVYGVNVDNTDPKHPIVDEFRPINDYNNDMLLKADIDGNLTIGGIWWQDQVLSDRFTNYKQVWTALTNNTIEWGNVELDKHIFLVDDANGLKVKFNGSEGTIWNSFNLTNVSQLNNDAGYLQANDLDGFIYDVTYDSATHTITFFQQNEPNIVIDLPIEQLIKGVQLVGDDLVFTFEDGSTVTVPLNTLLVGVVKSVNGKTPNSQGEIILNVTDIPNLSSALDGKANVSGNNLTNIGTWQSSLGINNLVPYTGATANVNLGERSITSTGGFIGNASTATTLATARTINGTSFNGSANITTSNWGTARNITIGNKTLSVNGSGNYSWSLDEIGATTETWSKDNFHKLAKTNAEATSAGYYNVVTNVDADTILGNTSIYPGIGSTNVIDNSHLISYGVNANYGWQFNKTAGDNKLQVRTRINGSYTPYQIVAYEDWVTQQIPTNYITTNTNQTWISGDKTSSGIWTFGQVRKAGQNDTQILLAGGGHRPASDFALATDIPDVSGFVPSTRSITAGNGLYGGGDLNENRTFTLGTPSSIGLTSTNSVTSTSHTHDLDAATITAINQGVTAHGWGNHSGKYLPLDSITTLVRDADLMKESGVFVGYQWTNTPIPTIGVMTVKRYSDDWVKQTFEVIGVQNETYVRSFYNGSTWSPWLREYNGGDFNPAQYVLQSVLNTQLANYVPINGVTTINNTKTFTSSPIVPNATLNNHAVNLGQLNTLLGDYATEDWVNQQGFVTSDTTYSAGAGISISDNVITNTAPNAMHTGDVTGTTYLTIANNAVTNPKMGLMNANSIKGRVGSVGNPQDLAPSQVRTMLNVQEGANRTRIGINGYNYTEVGDINLIAGSNVSLSKSGSNITINSSSQPIDTTVKLYMPGEVVNNGTVSCTYSKTIIYLSPTFTGPLNIAIDPDLQDGAELIVIHTYYSGAPGLFNINCSLIDMTGQLISSHMSSQGKSYRFIYVKDYGRFALVDGGQL